MFEFLSLSKSGWVQPSVDETRKNLQDELAIIKPDIRTGTPAGLFSGFIDIAVMLIMEVRELCAELLYSISPQFQNEILINIWLSLFGLTRGDATRRSVYVTFSGATGFYINSGLLVSTSDNRYRFKVVSGGTIGNSGNITLWCVSTSDEEYNVVVPINSITLIGVSIPSIYNVTCDNLSEGFLGKAEESLQDIRTRCLFSIRRTGTGCIDYAKELLAIANNNELRLISIQSVSDGYKIICGGGDLTAIADALYKSGLDFTRFKHGDVANRNMTQVVISHPDSYQIKFVLPFPVIVFYQIIWATESEVLIPDSTVADATIPLVNTWTNSLEVGKKINILELKNVWLDGFNTISDKRYLSRLTITVTINGVLQNPITNTELISINNEAYPVCYPNNIQVSSAV